MDSRTPALHFVPYGELDGAPHVVVDGSPTEGTVLCLSHWPGIESPVEFAADTSAEMAFSYLGAFDRHAGAEAVSNNHFDQDGLVSVFALTAPGEALERRDLLVDVARAGDFATFSSRDAAHISMAVAAFADPERSPLPELAAVTDGAQRTALLYEELLGHLREVCDHPDRFHALWGEEEATLAASEAAVESGAVSISEVDDIDLAVVTVAPGAPDRGGHRFTGAWVDGVHPMAVHNATRRGAILMTRGRAHQLTYRYESWVQYRSRAVRSRVDLAPLAAQLNNEETAPGTWVAQPVSALTPTLSLQGCAESDIPAPHIRALVESHLRGAPPAWDPYHSA